MLKFEQRQRTFVHLVDISPWPLLSALSIWFVAIGLLSFMHLLKFSEIFVALSIGLLSSVAYLWWVDVINEGTFQGKHTKIVQRGLRGGFYLFILSEVMFFFAFFWTFFHSSLAPTFQIGSIWPPEGIIGFDPFGVPLLNTTILLASGFTVTYAHYSLIRGKQMTVSMIMTILLALFFTLLQLLEYQEALFDISSGIYGSIFFMATGFHGFHVLIGTIFLFICFLRYRAAHFTNMHHLGFESAIWYWHFVDVVWLFLFVAVYVWGNAGNMLVFGGVFFLKKISRIRSPSVFIYKSLFNSFFSIMLRVSGIILLSFFVIFFICYWFFDLLGSFYFIYEYVRLESFLYNLLEDSFFKKEFFILSYQFFILSIIIHFCMAIRIFFYKFLKKTTNFFIKILSFSLFFEKYIILLILVFFLINFFFILFTFIFL